MSLGKSLTRSVPSEASKGVLLSIKKTVITYTLGEMRLAVTEKNVGYGTNVYLYLESSKKEGRKQRITGKKHMVGGKQIGSFARQKKKERLGIIRQVERGLKRILKEKGNP